jgi:uncharacterized membrane protein
VIFAPKRREFTAKYLSDISKLFFAAGVVKQFFGEAWNFSELILGVMISFIVFAAALVFHPAE